MLLDFAVIVSPFSLRVFNVGMDIRSGSTDLAVLLISLDSRSLVLRNNKTCTSVVQPLPSLTMCTRQKSPLFLQLIISSIHTRQRVCETASLQRAIYHLSQEQRLKSKCGADTEYRVFWRRTDESDSDKFCWLFSAFSARSWIRLQFGSICSYSST